MRGPRWKLLRRDQIFACPDAAQRIQPIGQCFAEHDNVRNDFEVFDGPHFSSAIEAHLDFVVHHQDFVVVQYSLELWEIPRRRNYVTASSLNRLDIECGKLSLPCLRIPERVVLGLEVSLKLFDAIQPAVFSLLSVGAAEAIREWDDVGAVREMSETAAITIARRDC